MNANTDTPLTLHEIPYANMEYFFLARDLLLWKVDSRYVTGEEDDNPRKQYFTVKGIIEIEVIDGLSQSFDTQTEKFEVCIHLNGHHISFSTPKENEAEALYDLLMQARYGVRMKDHQGDMVKELMKDVNKG